MDIQKIKFAIQNAPEQTSIFVEKFLDAKTFCLLDICWWWDPQGVWFVNKKGSEKLLQLLMKEQCCKRIACDTYIKNLEFIVLLEQMLRLEEILEGE